MISDLIAVLTQDWSQFPLPWAFALAFCIMTFVGFTLNRDAKDEVALWLMGGYLFDWPKAFLHAFDTFFFGGTSATGVRRAVQSFVVSALMSIGFVLLVWNVMGGEDLLGPRTDETMSWQTLLMTAVAVNVVVDYLSIRETRWLLGRLTRLPLWSHLPILLADLVVTSVPIWGALWLWQKFGWYTGQPVVLGEVAGGFSVLSVFFYSTFLTSLWAWLYVMSAWIMRASMALKLERWSSVTERPGLFLSALLFVSSVSLATPVEGFFKVDEKTGVSFADNALCAVFNGKVCIRIFGLSGDEQAQLTFLNRACSTGFYAECTLAAQLRYQIEMTKIASIWQIACENGEARSCSNLGFVYEEGKSLPQDHDKAAALYSRGCTGGHALGCTHLGVLYEDGFKLGLDYQRAREMYSLGCDGRHAMGCANLGTLYWYGRGVSTDRDRARELFQQACELGQEDACRWATNTSQE